MRNRYFFIMAMFLFIGCDNFKDMEYGKYGKECFSNGTCRGELTCNDGICVNPDEGFTDADEKADEDADENQSDDENLNTGDRVVLLSHTLNSVQNIFLVSDGGKYSVKINSYTDNVGDGAACLSPSGSKLAILNSDLSSKKIEVWQIQDEIKKISTIDLTDLYYELEKVTKCDFLSEERLVVGYYTTSGTNECPNMNKRAISLWDISKTVSTLLSSALTGCSADTTLYAVPSRNSIFGIFWPANWSPDTFVGELSLKDDIVPGWGEQVAQSCGKTDGHSKGNPSVSDSGNKLSFSYNRASGYSGAKDVVYCLTDDYERKTIVKCPEDKGGHRSVFLSEEKILANCDGTGLFEVDLSEETPVDTLTCEGEGRCIKWDLSEISETFDEPVRIIDSAPWDGSSLPDNIFEGKTLLMVNRKSSLNSYDNGFVEVLNELEIPYEIGDIDEVADERIAF